MTYSIKLLLWNDSMVRLDQYDGDPLMLIAGAIDRGWFSFADESGKINLINWGYVVKICYEENK